MQEVTVIIPNWNGKEYIRECLNSLLCQDLGDIPIVIVDNGSTDGSVELIQSEYPQVKLVLLDQNYGFCKAVNEGIRRAETSYVILLNNDTRVERDFAGKLLAAIKRKECIFSCQAKMLQMDNPGRMDDGGNYYCALGWAFARGKNQDADRYDKAAEIFSACAGAAIYRRSLFQTIGYFDEKHFAYLEDVDVGYRARIAGYENWYEPEAVVYHKGSGSSGSRYNKFKARYSGRNNIYLIYKNMAWWQILLNLPFLLAGFLIKMVFFIAKGLGFAYLQGMWQGILLAREGEKVPFLAENFDNCCKIQLELWRNVLYRLRENK